MIKHTKKDKNTKGNSIVPLIRVTKIPWGGSKVICGMDVLVLFICEIYLLKCMSPKMVTYHHFGKEAVSPNLLTTWKECDAWINFSSL